MKFWKPEFEIREILKTENPGILSRETPNDSLVVGAQRIVVFALSCVARSRSGLQYFSKSSQLMHTKVTTKACKNGYSRASLARAVECCRDGWSLVIEAGIESLGVSHTHKKSWPTLSSSG